MLTYLTGNFHFIKRVPVLRVIFLLAGLFFDCSHLLIQIALLFTMVFLFGGKTPNRYWLWLPIIWGLEVVFVCGLSLITSALNVYVRDMRYVVESTNTVLFWLVPIFYSFSMIPAAYASVYELNPVAALVLAMRNILLEAKPPSETLLVKLALSSTMMFVIGWTVFGRLKRSFYDQL
jgi:ABC-type polysaccharide/polyol phosphate export permease